MERTVYDLSRKQRNRQIKKRVLTAFLFFQLTMSGFSQQTASTVEPPRTVDLEFKYEVSNPAFPEGEGPVVIVDEAHFNFHTSVGTYYPFSELLKQDGYVLRRGRGKINRELLESCRIYVIADAQPPEKQGDPPTFTEEEIFALNKWVKSGGSLFVITDHLPDPWAIAPLALSFGIEVNNGYILNGAPEKQELPIVFKKAGMDRIEENPITRGRIPSEGITQVATFSGSAFQAGDNFIPILVFKSGRKSWMPKKYYDFDSDTPTVDVGGWYQGGVMEYGKGRIVFFAEAAMFTAQVFERGRTKVGMNHPQSKDNAQLLLNVVHWLSKIY
ncbi:hypothetical protein ACFLT9_00825 [Acidobacteriota bacterium]